MKAIAGPDEIFNGPLTGDDRPTGPVLPFFRSASARAGNFISNGGNREDPSRCSRR
jgi:hypothetical protein